MEGAGAFAEVQEFRSLVKILATLLAGKWNHAVFESELFRNDFSLKWRHTGLMPCVESVFLLWNSHICPYHFVTVCPQKMSVLRYN